MTKTQIDCFFEIIRLHSFTRAANELYISQPAISRNISKLEEELGFKLFDRSGAELSVTEAGKLMYNFLKSVQKEYNDTLEEIYRVSSSSGRLLRIGCPEIWNPRFFINAVSPALESAFPGLRLTVEPYRMPELISRLDNGWFDIVAAHEFNSLAISGPKVELLTNTGCGILFSREHFPQARTPADFSETSFVLYDSNVSRRLGALISEVCADYGFQPKIRTVGQPASALFETAEGKSVMFFSDWDSSAYNGLLEFMPLPKKMSVNIIYYPERLSKTTLEQVKTIKSAFSD
jgi:DNA-binding transcriptional LysR family regulator